MTKKEFLIAISIPAMVVLYLFWSNILYKDIGPASELL